MVGWSDIFCCSVFVFCTCVEQLQQSVCSLRVMITAALCIWLLTVTSSNHGKISIEPSKLDLAILSSFGIGLHIFWNLWYSFWGNHLPPPKTLSIVQFLFRVVCGTCWAELILEDFVRWRKQPFSHTLLLLCQLWCAILQLFCCAIVSRIFKFPYYSEFNVRRYGNMFRQAQ